MLDKVNGGSGKEISPGAKFHPRAQPMSKFADTVRPQHCPLDYSIGFDSIYPVDGDLSAG